MGFRVDGDVMWHFKTGEFIVNNGYVPKHDVFSWQEGLNWMCHEWLYDVILYLLYYNLLSLCFGLLGKKVKAPLKWLPLIVIIACVCTVCFSLIDNILTPLWYGYSKRAAKAYFYASLPFMLPQIVCTAVSVACLFIPLFKIFCLLKRKL